MLEEIMREHRSIECCVAALEGLLASKTPPPRAALAERRLTLGRISMQHMSAEREHLFARLEAGSSPMTDAARAARREVADLFADYVAHNNRWSLAAIELDWEGYRADARRLMKRLRACIVLEERDLYPHLVDGDQLAFAATLPDRGDVCHVSGKFCAHGCRKAA